MNTPVGRKLSSVAGAVLLWLAAIALINSSVVSSHGNLAGSCSGVPRRFLLAANGDVAEGRRRYAATAEWRRRERIDSILHEPHPNFDLIKRHYPHFFHLRGKRNEPVYYESPAKMNLEALKAAGLSMADLLRHYAFLTEFMWSSNVEPSDEGKSIYVIDLDGIRLQDFVGDVVRFVKSAADFTSKHYPERSGNIFVVNVPRWFNVIWRVVKPVVDPVTLEKIQILPRGDDEGIRLALLEKIPLENIPPEYGGGSVPLGYSPEERKLAGLMRHNNYHLTPPSGHWNHPGFEHELQTCTFCAYQQPPAQPHHQYQKASGQSDSCRPPPSPHRGWQQETS